jgi:hypothetical protein
MARLNPLAEKRYGFCKKCQGKAFESVEKLAILKDTGFTRYRSLRRKPRASALGKNGH